MAFNKFVKELNGNRVEGELLHSIFYSLLTSFAILGGLYYFFFQNIENFMPKYGIFMFLSALSYAFFIAIVRQVRAYEEFACMAGMMIGMTAGMMGFLPGFYVASTNGMFIGGFFGVAIGMFLGVWTGKSCGIMGIMEGMMASLMGGLMGAMTAFMLFNDNLIVAAVLVFIICAVILSGLSYMIYFEMKDNDRGKKENHFLSVGLTAALTLITVAVMLHGPRSAIFS